MNRYNVREKQGNYLAISYVARVLNRTPQRIIQLVREGRLTGIQSAGKNSKWFIEPRSLERYQKELRQ